VIFYHLLGHNASSVCRSCGKESMTNSAPAPDNESRSNVVVMATVIEPAALPALTPANESSMIQQSADSSPNPASPPERSRDRVSDG